MFLLPVAAREVREASRQSRTYAWRWVTAAVGLIFMAFIAWISRNTPRQGHNLFTAISTIAFLYCLIAGVVRTADTIAEEKRDNTLGLLFLTDLKGWDIILGKLLSSSVNCLFGLLALIPMLAIPMMMGGVQWSEFTRMILSLFTVLLLSISWGFLISSLFRMTVVTISTGLGVMILVAAGLPMLALFLDDQLHLKFLAAAVFVFSPTHCHVFAFDVSAPSYIQHYWTSLAINFSIALINLRLAIFFLPRFWQEVPKNQKTERWRNRVRALRFGEPKAKKRLRTRLLNQNPFFWLANREQVSSAGLMVTCVFILVVALAIGIASASAAWRGTEEIMVAWMVGLSLVHLIIAFRMAMSASYRLSEDRRSGALELLLGTEVSIKELLRGYWMALGRQFFGPAMIAIFSGVFAVMMMLMIFSDTVHAGNVVDTLVEIVSRIFRRGEDKEAGLIFFVVVSIQFMLALNWIALIWVGMWLGLREKRAGFATWVTLSLVLVPPWALLIAGVVTVVEMGIVRGIQPDEGITSLLVAGWILGVTHITVLSLWARGNLMSRFREAAADRYMGPRRFAWPKVQRIAIRLAAAGACVLLLLYGARFVVDRRGEKVWAAARAKYPAFKLEQPPAKLTIPDAKNLAQAPLFRGFAASGASRKVITWDLSGTTGGGMRGDFMEWAWSERRRMNLSRLEGIYIDRKFLKEERETPALTVLEGLATYDDQLADLREEATARPLLQYARWTPPRVPQYVFPAYYSMYNPSQADIRGPLRQLIETLAVRTSARLAIGDTDTGDLFLALRLADGIKDLPVSIIQYHEMTLDCVQPIYDGVTRRAWKNDDLKKIQDHFAALDFFGGFENFREDYIRRVIEESEGVIQSRRGRGPSRESWLARQAPVGLRRTWQAETLEWGMTALPKIVNIKARRIDAMALREIPKTRPEPPTGRRYPDQVVMTIRSLGFTQTTADQIIVACSVERFRNDYGNLPRNLRELIPKYLSAIPHDIFTGEPLGYIVQSDQQNYSIYGIGPDGQDNKGNPTYINGIWALSQDRPSVDWVWSSAAVDAPRAVRKKSKTKK